MTRPVFGSNATPSLATLDQALTELYYLRERISDPNYTASNPAFAIDSLGRLSFAASRLEVYQIAGSDTFLGRMSSASGSGLSLTSTVSTMTAAYFQTSAGASGGINCSGNTTSYVTSSDRRIKTGIVPLPDQGSVIDAIEPVEFEFASEPGRKHAGFIAQDLHAVVPNAVQQGDAGASVVRPWGTDPSKLVVLLVRELQSVRARLAALEAA